MLFQARNSRSEHNATIQWREALLTILSASDTAANTPGISMARCRARIFVAAGGSVPFSDPSARRS